MDDIRDGEGFRFTYSANEQEELRMIRQKYLPPEEDKMHKVRQLDAHAANKGMVVALIMGELGALIMGGGMSLLLVLQGSWFIPGLLIGLIGMVIAGLAYPVYQYVVKQEREKIAAEILRLTEELIK